MDLMLSKGQFYLVYNSFSFVIACMGAALIFFLLVRNRVAPRHRMAITLSTLVVAIAMILLGWPGEVSAADSTARTVWGVLSTLPFLNILYVLFVELGKSLGRQSDAVRKLVDGLRYIILATWGIYPIAYMLPSLIDNEATAEVARQVGYAIGDVLAKPLFGLLVLGIALAKSREDGYAPALEEAHADA
jgi:bacteriorhodopsin